MSQNIKNKNFPKKSNKRIESEPIHTQQTNRVNVKASYIDSNKNTYIFAGITILITLVAFLPSLFCDFTNLDDQYYVLNNPDIKSISFNSLKTLFTNFYVGNYQPLAMLTYAIEFKLAGLSPFMFHFTNFILHLLNTLLVFIFIKKLSGKNLTAVIAAILFGIHPMHVESVAWVSERKDVLYAFFYIAALITYLKFKESNDKKFYFITLLLFVLSCISKAMAVWLPIVLMLIDYLQDKKISFKPMLNKIPFFAISMFFGLLAIHVQKIQGASTFIDGVNGIYSFSDKIFIASYSLFFYIYKMFLPIGLAVIHPYPDKITGSLPMIYYVSLFVNLVVIILVFISYKKTKKVIFGYLFFFANIFQVLQILSIGSAIAADRYFYISSIGLFYFIGEGFNEVYTNPKYKNYKQVLIIVSGTIILVFTVMTFNRVNIWKNSATLWTDMIKTYPDNELPYFNRGGYYYEKNQKELALQDFSLAIDKYPYYQGALSARLTLLLDKKDADNAIKDLSTLIKLNPEKTEYYIKRGVLYRDKQQNKLAIEDFESAVKIDPNNFAGYMNIAIENCINGNINNAGKYFGKAKELSPKTAEIYSNEGNMFAIMKDYNNAIADYTKSLEIDSTLTYSYLYRAFNYYDIQKYDLALIDLKKFVSIEPNNPNANLKLSNVYSIFKDKKNALEYALKAKQGGLSVDENYIKSLQ